jgi:mono/diheme cytochrome c family protein
VTVRIAVLLVTLAGASAALADDGPALYAKHCAMCHQPGAVGVAGQFPRLAGRVGRISRSPEGRTYLIDVVSYGMAGVISVDQQPIMGLMPPLQLSDDDAASVLSYVASVGAPAAVSFTAAEVAAERAKARKSSAEVLAERQGLQKAKVVD